MTVQLGPLGSQHPSRGLLDDPNDPRVGSGRDNSTGGTLSHLGGGDGGSLEALGLTFAPILIYSVICLLIFLCCRRRSTRVYSPRTVPALRHSEDVSPTLPPGWFNWIKPFFKTPDAVVLHNSSLDGFFFLRYIKLLAVISLTGCVCAWPILLPVHGTGTNRLTQLELLTIGNLGNSKAYYAHIVVAYLFFGFVLFTICRECVYWINLRQAYLLAPRQANRLSSRTVLFTCVPEPYLHEGKIRKLFGPSVRKIWIPTNTRELDRLVEEREQTAVRLEKAEIDLIKLANAARNKAISKHMKALRPHRTKPFGASSHNLRRDTGASYDSRSVYDGKPGHEMTQVRGGGSVPVSPMSEHHPRAIDCAEEELYTHPYGLSASLPDVRGSVAAQWIPAEARPTHRPLANFGRRVDTIRWTRDRIKKLNRQIAKLRRQHRRGDGTPLNSVFVAFDNQANAQMAYQTLAHHLPLHMAPRFIGVKPNDIVWHSLRIKWWERIMRRFFIMGFVAVAIMFWSIPSAIVGAISNLDSLATNVPFLAWVLDIPSPVLSVLKGLLPALALSALMAVVPALLRACAIAAGVPTKPQIEIFVQNAYFVFQVVQVFLITTLTSAASAAFFKILEDPLSAKDLLSQNLPKASNFYLSYILVQCLGRSAWSLAHIPELIRHNVIGKSIQNPRARFRTWNRLKVMHWGGVYPVFTNMGVIVMCYACIAPLILAFSGIGMICIYFAYRYNLIYSFDSESDSEGLLYPRALIQLIVGLYLAQICLIGLFVIQVAFVPMVLMIAFFVFTIIVHISLNDALGPLFYSLPRTLALQGHDSVEDEGMDGKMDETSTFYDSDLEDPFPFEEQAEEHITTATRGIEGGSSFVAATGRLIKSMFMSKVKSEAETSGLTQLAERLSLWFTPDPTQPPNFFTRWLHPDIFDDYYALQQKLSSSTDETEQEAPYPDKYLRDAYWPPEMWTPVPKLWIPRDDARVSRQEVAHTREMIPIFDTGAWLDEKGRICMDLDQAPFDKPRVAYRLA